MTDAGATTETGRTTVFQTVVRESIVETADTRTLLLDPGTPRTDWHAGQYVSVDPHQFPGLASLVAFLEHAKGRREVARAYSMCSAPHEPLLAITIKEEVFVAGRTKYPPLLSGYLVHQVRGGDHLEVRGFAGGYLLPHDVERRTAHVLHLCAGSGSVPNVSMIKDSLLRHHRLRHTLLYSNKTWDDIIFRDALAVLAAEHPDRFQVYHALTRQATAAEHGPNVRSGRIDAEWIRQVLAHEPDSLIYACGPAVTVWDRRACAAQGTTPPPQFLEAMLGHLETIGVPRARIKIEAFG
jgi:ferredoxin-NADP reductase